MTVKELAGKQGFKSVAMPDGNREIHGIYIGDLLSWVMGRAKADDAWITIMSNINIVAVATLTDVACVLLAEDVTPEEDVRAVAEQKGVNLLTSPLTAYELATKLATLL